MPKRLDLIGQKFERLTVIEFDSVKSKNSYFLCKCYCGNKKIVSGQNLKSGRVRSCGCLAKENNQNKRIPNRIEINGDIAKVYLRTKNEDDYIAIIDKEDLDKVAGYTWYLLTKSDGTHHGVATHIKNSNGVRTTLLLHRHLMQPKDSKIFIDHKDGCPLNNRRCNLRFCSNTENQWNQHSISGKSKYKGVVWDQRSNKWLARIQVNKKRIYLGSFREEFDAARTYNEAALKYFGDFGKVNAIA